MGVVGFLSWLGFVNETECCCYGGCVSSSCVAEFCTDDPMMIRFSDPKTARAALGPHREHAFVIGGNKKHDGGSDKLCLDF